MKRHRLFYLEGKNSPFLPRIALVKDEKISALVVDLKKDEDKQLFETKTFEISGLALEFSRVKKDRDAADFANKYGLLGVNRENMEILDYDHYYLRNFKFDENPTIEFLDEWHWHVRHVSRLLKLFDALQNSKPIEEKHLIIAKRTEFNPPSKRIDPSFRGSIPRSIDQSLEDYEKAKSYVPPEFHVYWANNGKVGDPTMIPYLEGSEEKNVEDEYRTYAWLVLESHIKAVIKNAIFIDFDSVRPDKKAAFGFSYTDRKATQYLLAAIYYDLYRIVNNIDEVISFCTICGGAFKNKRKGTIFCSNACKQHKKNNPEEYATGKDVAESVQT